MPRRLPQTTNVTATLNVLVRVVLSCLGALGSPTALVGRAERGSFSLKGCFREVHGPDAKTVTLGEDGIRTLEDAIAALRPDGGVILVPPGTYENKNFRLGKRSMSVTLKGILGPDARRPRFLFKGPKPSGVFMSFGVSPWAKYKDRIAAPPNRDQALVENLEIGGYGAALSIGNCARFVLLGSWDVCAARTKNYRPQTVQGFRFVEATDQHAAS
jgi:hypothetical protein